jgi:hypothetical protein
MVDGRMVDGWYKRRWGVRYTPGCTKMNGCFRSTLLHTNSTQSSTNRHFFQKVILRVYVLLPVRNTLFYFLHYYQQLNERIETAPTIFVITRNSLPLVIRV